MSRINYKRDKEAIRKAMAKKKLDDGTNSLYLPERGNASLELELLNKQQSEKSCHTSLKPLICIWLLKSDFLADFSYLLILMNNQYPNKYLTTIANNYPTEKMKRKDGEFWRNELLKLEHIDLPKEPEFGWHPLTESIKYAQAKKEIFNLYGAASIACFGLFESDSKEAKKLLKQALLHANREDEYYYFLYCIKSGVERGEVTMAQGLMAEYLKAQVRQQIHDDNHYQS